MRKIDITNYPVEQDGKTLPYGVKEAAVEVLFAPNLKVRAQDIFKRDDVARKIETAEGDEVLLEEAEYEMLKAGVNAIEGYRRSDVEFVRRILEAPTVEVEEKRGTNA